MQPIRRVLFVCLGLSISFIGLLVWNIPLRLEDSINDLQYEFDLKDK